MSIPDDPFAVKPIIQKTELSHEPLSPDLSDTYTKIREDGHIVVCRQMNGQEVVIVDKGSIKNKAKAALYEAAMMLVSDSLPDPDNLTHLQLAAIQLVKSASLGNMAAIDSVFDRILGKPKQQIEQKNLNLTIDDILGQAISDDGELNYGGES